MCICMYICMCVCVYVYMSSTLFCLFFYLVYKNSADELAIERKIGQKSDLNETEHPVLMV